MPQIEITEKVKRTVEACSRCGARESAGNYEFVAIGDRRDVLEGWMKELCAVCHGIVFRAGEPPKKRKRKVTEKPE